MEMGGWALVSLCGVRRPVTHSAYLLHQPLFQLSFFPEGRSFNNYLYFQKAVSLWPSRTSSILL